MSTAILADPMFAAPQDHGMSEATNMSLMQQHTPTAVSGLTSILLASSSAAAETRNHAEQQLKDALLNNVNDFFRHMVLELSDDTKPDIARSLAGIQLKNALYGKSRAFQKQAEDTWVHQVSADVKSLVRMELLKSLDSPEFTTRKFAVMVMSKLSAIEIPYNLWPELLSNLLERVNDHEKFNSSTRKSCIQALGYISEEMSLLQDRGLYSLNQEHSLQIVAAVYQGLCENPIEILNQTQFKTGHELQAACVGNGNTNLTLAYQQYSDRKGIRLEACKALYFVLSLTYEVFEKEEFRQALLTTLLQCCQECRHPEIQCFALEALTRVVEFFYSYLSFFIEDLATTTFTLMNMDGKFQNREFLQPGQQLTDPPSSGNFKGVQIRALGVWQQICDTELEIQEEINDHMRAGIAYPSTSTQPQDLIKKGSSVLIPKLLSMLIDVEQADDYDLSDEYSLKMAAQVALKLSAQLVKDDILDLILPFVTNNINSPDWRAKEAAILALGSVMEGPTSADRVSGVLKGAYSHLFEILKQQPVALRDTTAWTIGSMTKHHLKTILEQQRQNPNEPEVVVVGTLLNDLCERMKIDEPRVCAHICFAIHIICEQSLFEFNQQAFQTVVEVLITAADKDPSQQNLSSSSQNTAKLSSIAYNALAILIKKSDPKAVGQAYGFIMEEIGKRLNKAIEQNRADPQCETHGNLAIILSELLDKHSLTDLSTNPHLIQTVKVTMSLYEKVFELYSSHNPGCVHPDILLTTSTLIKKLGKDFKSFLPFLGLLLQTGLQNPEDAQSCSLCVRLVGNPLASAFGADFSQYAPQLVPEIIKLALNPGSSLSLKIACLNSLGDVALAMQGAFDVYIPSVMNVINAASSLEMTEDNMQTVNRLREAVIECYTSIMHGLNDGGKVNILLQSVSGFCHLIGLIIQDCSRQRSTDEVLRGSIAALGDLVGFFGREFVSHLKTLPWLQELERAASKDKEVQESLGFLIQQMRKFQ